jgi:hypothetical protein
MDSVFPRFITCRRNDATIAATADNQRLAKQCRIIALFDGGVKRIHIDMQNFSLCGSPQD